MPYRLSEAAKQDLVQIYRYGFHAFGEAQADSYYAGLIQRFEDIAVSPGKYPPVDHIRKHYRRSVFGVDSIYYRLNAEDVEIMRVLGRQNLDVLRFGAG